MLELADTGGRRRKQARPRELLDAALAVFVEKGFAAARAEEIAARAGVSKGTLYLYFDSKEDLLRTLIAERFSLRIDMRTHRVATSAGASGERTTRAGRLFLHAPDLLSRHTQLVLEGLYRHPGRGQEGDATSTGN